MLSKLLDLIEKMLEKLPLPKRVRKSRTKKELENWKNKK